MREVNGREQTATSPKSPHSADSNNIKNSNTILDPLASPNSDVAPSLHIVPYEQDLLGYLSHLIIQQNQESLPDLTNSVVLLSQSRAAAWFRKQLLREAQLKNVSALLGPQIDTFYGWINNIVLPDAYIISDEARELLLVEALMEHPHLYGHGSAFTLATSLMELFDDLTRHFVELPSSLDEFQLQLQKTYGCSDMQLNALSKEATLVHTLWQAMHQQLEAQQVIDQATAQVLKLQHSFDSLSSDTCFYVVGFNDFSRAEWQWLRRLSRSNHLYIVVQGDTYDDTDKISAIDSAYLANNRFIDRIKTELTPSITRVNSTTDISEFISSVFSPHQSPLKKRTEEFARRFASSPVAKHFSTFEAHQSEVEAHAIELQVRRWLVQGLTHIGIITENRRLARRLRALLERSGILLNDAAGWALSTTSAATIVERWLQCIEEDFHHLPFLDFLKSPYVLTSQDRQSYLTTVYHLEKSIVIDENVASGLQRYLSHAALVQNRLSTELSRYLDAIPPLLHHLEEAAQPMIALHDDRPHLPGEYLQALTTSLTALEVSNALNHDAAGNQLLNLLERLKTATRLSNVKMLWVEFRAWLGAHLEQSFFQPPNINGSIQLMNLAQSDLQQFDAVIIASAEQQFLPGTPSYSPFFNDAVRASLGVTTVEQKQADKFYYFRRLLQSVTPATAANYQARILITWTGMQDDEELIPSPWLEALQSFHRLTYGCSLEDSQLKAMVENKDSQIYHDTVPLPHQQPANPQTAVSPNLIPKTISASAYQQIMNCPYQFFASRCLRLSPPDTVRDMLQKDDYGEKVHLCLQAFHSKVAQLPGPFKEPFTENNQDKAIALLEEISRQVFAKDIEDNFIHKGWLKRWREMIPNYIQWQTEQASKWKVWRVESEAKNIPLSPTCTLTGRLDRIDCADNTLKIIDYKTGRVPSVSDVENGEAVQLPFYAMLSPKLAAENYTVERVEYLSLDANKFGAKVFMEGAQLNELQHCVAHRLGDIMDALHKGHELPAWGDSSTCGFCVMKGLCRKGMWSEQ